MEEDKLKSLFDSYSPNLSPDGQFLSRLQHNLEAVEFVRQRQAALRRRHRVALAAAVAAGFVVGVVFASFLPLAGDFVVNLSWPLVRPGSLGRLTIDYNVVVWAIVGGAAMLTGLNTYTIVLARTKSRPLPPA